MGKRLTKGDSSHLRIVHLTLIIFFRAGEALVQTISPVKLDGGSFVHHACLPRTGHLSQGFDLLWRVTIVLQHKHYLFFTRKSNSVR